MDDCSGVALTLCNVKTTIAILFIAVTTAFAQYNAADLRIVDGTPYNIQTSTKWEDIAWSHNYNEYYTILVVRGILNDGSLDCDQEFYDSERDGGIFLSSVNRLILKNYPGEPHIGMKITKCRAMRLPNKPGDTVNTYDYGTEPTQNELKKLKAEADERQKAAEKELDAQRRAAAEKAAAAKKSMQDNVLKWNQQQADKGDAYGLLRMGERYRDGDGVPKDLTKAREYLTKASAAGSPDAAGEISKLNQVSTNSPAKQ
jgi:hypothetical protein